MGEGSKIEWTHHTFNPWWGCTKVSAGCTNCYAESFAKRTGNAVWGDGAPRRFFGDKHWAEPLKWNAAAEKAGERRRVFCASMADVFEDRRDLDDQRARLWQLILHTPWLDWLLLTKRPENIGGLGDAVIERCWLGTTAENQEMADLRLPHLLKHSARVHFISAEPLLGPLDLAYTAFNGADSFGTMPGVDWVIVGGESGGGARPFALDWARDIVAQCSRADVACFVKQLGARPWEDSGQTSAPVGGLGEGRPYVAGRVGPSGTVLRQLRVGDSKGGDPSEWPEDLRVRQFPEARRA